MNKGMCFLIGAGTGAGLMYLFDSHAGRRRRAYLHDKAIHALNRMETSAKVAVEDLGNRARGIVSASRARVLGGQIPDDVLVERVRSKLGRYLSHPRLVSVTSENGCITLCGKLLASEAPPMLAALRSMHSVRNVRSELEIHSRPDVPELKGGLQRPGEQLDLFQDRWAPATQLLLAAGGLALSLYGIQRRGSTASVLGFIGSALVGGVLGKGFTQRQPGLNRQVRGMNGQAQRAIHKEPPQEKTLPDVAEEEKFVSGAVGEV
jgi:hypothetical protein